MDTLYPGIRRIIKRGSEEPGQAGKERFSARDSEGFYGLSGSYRGVSKALAGYEGSAAEIA